MKSGRKSHIDITLESLVMGKYLARLGSGGGGWDSYDMHQDCENAVVHGSVFYPIFGWCHSISQ